VKVGDIKTAVHVRVPIEHENVHELTGRDLPVCIPVKQTEKGVVLVEAAFNDPRF